VPTSAQSHAPLPTGFTQPSIIQARVGGSVKNVKPYDFETRRTIDVELADRAVEFIRKHGDDPDPFWSSPDFIDTQLGC